jgi:hypothetical protein
MAVHIRRGERPRRAASAAAAGTGRAGAIRQAQDDQGQDGRAGDDTRDPFALHVRFSYPDLLLIRIKD